MNDRLKELEAEPISVGRIGVSEAHASAAVGRDIFAERVEQHITKILEKYGCVLSVTEFHWMQGHGGGTISVIRKPLTPAE